MKQKELEQIAELVARKLRGEASTTEESAAQKPEVMVTLTVRVPAEFLDLLDRIGPSRSEALRDILREVQVKRAKK